MHIVFKNRLKPISDFLSFLTKHWPRLCSCLLYTSFICLFRWTLNVWCKCFKVELTAVSVKLTIIHSLRILQDVSLVPPIFWNYCPHNSELLQQPHVVSSPLTQKGLNFKPTTLQWKLGFSRLATTEVITTEMLWSKWRTQAEEGSEKCNPDLVLLSTNR